mgnify:CR=1 FL=1
MLAELETALSIMETLQNEILAEVEGLTAEELNWIPPVAQTNSVFAIATHAAASQKWWICENLAGQKIVRDREAEFKAQGQTAADLRAAFDETRQLTREILAGLRPENLTETRLVKGKIYTVRWIVYHVIEHTALHLGHIQITKQWIQEKRISV